MYLHSYIITWWEFSSEQWANRDSSNFTKTRDDSSKKGNGCNWTEDYTTIHLETT